MKTKGKKLLALILSAAMCMTGFSGAAFASESEPGTEFETGSGTEIETESGTEAVTGNEDVTTIFWPYFDGVLDNKDTWEMHIILMPVGGEFTDGFDEYAISLGYDFETAELTSFKESEGSYEIILSVPKEKEEETGKEEEYRYSGSITLAEGSMVKWNGEEVGEALSVTRAYTPETTGRVFTPMEIGQIKGIVGGFGNTTFGTISGIIGGGASAFSAAWTLLGLLGYVPTDASRHAEIMNALSQIQGQLTEIQGTVDYMRGMLDQHTHMLNELGITMDQFYLNDVGGDMIILTSLMEEITRALKTKSNRAAIDAAIEEIAEEYKTTPDAGRDLDPEEMEMPAPEEDGFADDSYDEYAGEYGEDAGDYYDEYVEDYEEDAGDFYAEEYADDYEEASEEFSEEYADDFEEVGEDFTEVIVGDFEEAGEDLTEDLAPGEPPTEEDGLDWLVEDRENMVLEVEKEDRILDQEEIAEMQMKLSKKISVLPQSANYTIGDKIRSLKSTYDSLQKKFHTGDKSNPINAYIDLHSRTDNFATTSLNEKVMYAEEIKYELNRALVMLEVLDGVDSHEQDRRNFESCIFPDPEIGVMDAEGHPWCYPLGGYVKLSGDEISTVYLPIKNKSKDKVTIFPEEVANDFAGRLQGRTCREELLQAGFTEEQMDVMTSFNESDLIKNRKYNVSHAGLAFEYECWANGTKPCKDIFYNTFGTDEKLVPVDVTTNNWGTISMRFIIGCCDQFYLDMLASHLGQDFDGYYPFSVPGESRKDNNTFAVVSRGLGWDDTEMVGYSVDATYNDRYMQSIKGNTYKFTSVTPEYFTGWAPYYPKHYLIVVSTKYLTK